jgi:hypothetical protein
MREAITSSTHASLAALRRVATSGLAAFSQMCTRWGLALGAILEDFSIARAQAVAGPCPVVEVPVVAVEPPPLVDLTVLLLV